jgi:hypothetical protein
MHDASGSGAPWILPLPASQLAKHSDQGVHDSLKKTAIKHNAPTSGCTNISTIIEIIE